MPLDKVPQQGVAPMFIQNGFHPETKGPFPVLGILKWKKGISPRESVRMPVHDRTSFNPTIHAGCKLVKLFKINIFLLKMWTRRVEDVSAVKERHTRLVDLLI